MECTKTDMFDQVISILRTRFEQDSTAQALPEPAQLEAALRESGACTLPAVGQPIEAVAQLLAQLLAHTPSTTGPRFFNQLFGGRDEAALLGEVAAAAMNNSMYTYKAAGAQVLLEQTLIAHMASMVGYGVAEGMFVPGGSLSNFAAMLTARNAAMDGCREKGFDGRTPVVYTSTESHYSVRKAAGMLGIGRDNVRFIEVDERGKMRPDALAKAIDTDVQAGLVPIMVNATAGTTVRGLFDPIREIAAVTQERGVWLHVDGAFGGSVLLNPQRRQLLDGSELADSFSWDAHKMMGVPLTCSVVLFGKPGVLQENLDESASYLFQRDSDVYNPGMRSLQCGRRNDALKLWTAWQFHGDEGYARRIEHLFELAQHAAKIIRAEPSMELAEEPESVNVCFVVQGVSAQAICDRLDRTGAIKVGHGLVNGQSTIRLVCVNADMDTQDIERFFDEVKQAAQALTC